MKVTIREMLSLPLLCRIVPKLSSFPISLLSSAQNLKAEATREKGAERHVVASTSRSERQADMAGTQGVRDKGGAREVNVDTDRSPKGAHQREYEAR